MAVSLAMHWTVVAFLLCYAGFALSDPISPPIPVQNTEPGIRHQPFDPPPKVRLEIFVDLNCPDSNAGWSVVKKVQEHYGNDRLDLVLQQLPLPFHRNALLSAQGMYVIQGWSSDAGFSYVEAVLARWNQFSTSKTVKKTEKQVIDDLADVAFEATGVDKKLFISDIGRHRSYAIAVWKYAAKRAVASTPTYFVNGVDVAVGKNLVPSFNEWIAFFDPIFDSS